MSVCTPSPAEFTYAEQFWTDAAGPDPLIRTHLRRLWTAQITAFSHAYPDEDPECAAHYPTPDQQGAPLPFSPADFLNTSSYNTDPDDPGVLNALDWLRAAAGVP